MVAFIAASYPGARDYLINEQELPAEQVKSYATAQVVFLALVRHHEHWRDEFFKWTHLPFWQARANADAIGIEEAMRTEARRYGWFTAPSSVLLPAIQAARTAEARAEQAIALLQTVEAIRMYATDNDGRLPPTLQALRLPSPVEPFTGKALQYEMGGNRAILTGHAQPGMRYRLILKIARK